MSSVPGLAVQNKDKGGKSKFQSLDINSLYRVSLGESLEPQQKTLPRKHGMQSLGKVPSARRPPANLPSLKSEHSGQDPAISLVPSGGAGWGAREGGGPTPPPSSQPQPSQQMAAQQQTQQVLTVASQQVVVTAASVPIATPASQRGDALPAVPSQSQQQTQQQAQQQTSRGGGASSGGQEKLWSSLMCSGTSGGAGGPQEGPSFLAHQNPMFQHEFPSLSEDQGKVGATVTSQQPLSSQDSQYGPGPSLRPQTEGSWIQGGMPRTGGGPDTGGRPVDPVAAAAAGGRPSSGMQGASQQASVPGGQTAPPLPPQLRGLIPPFMIKSSNFGPGGPQFPPNYMLNAAGQAQGFQQNQTGGPPGARQNRYPENRQGPPAVRYGAGGRPIEEDGLFTRPIIKEEDLKQLDEIVRDNGWATTDDIDYNQKLAFSDDEGQEDETRSRSRQQQPQQQQQQGPPGDVTRPSPQQQTTTEQNKDTREDRRPGSRGEMHRSWQQQQQQQPQSQQQQPPRGILPSDFHRQFPVKVTVFGPGQQQQAQQVPPSQQQGPGGPAASTTRLYEDEEVWRERRRQQSEEVALAVERAKQRKEEEEKRFRETKEAAAKKLQILEEKMGVAPSQHQIQSTQPQSPQGPPPPAQQQEETSSSSITSSIPEKCKSPQIAQQSECWASQVEAAEKMTAAAAAQQQQQQAQSPQTQQSQQPEFRPPQQQEHPVQSYTTEREREREVRKDRGPTNLGTVERERHEAMPFSPKFSEDLPPRFAKQKQMMLRSGPQQSQVVVQQQQSTTPPPLLATPIPPPPNFEQRWGSGHFGGKGQRGNRRGGSHDNDDDRPPSRDREALRGDKSERFRGGRGGPGGRYYETRDNAGDTWHRDDHQWIASEHSKEQPKPADSRHISTGEWFEEKENVAESIIPSVPPPLMGDWRAPEPPKEWTDSRPQRPDSRDSKASSRDSRHSDKQIGSSQHHQHQQQENAWGSSTAEQFYESKDSADKQSTVAARKGWKRDKIETNKDGWQEQGHPPSRSLVKSWGEDSTPPSSSSPGLELPSGTTKLGALLSDTLTVSKKQEDSLDSKIIEEQKGRIEGKGQRSRGRRDTRSPRGGGGSGSSGGNSTSAWPSYPVYQKTWGRSGSAASSEGGRGGRGRGSRLHPAPGAGRPSSAWEQDSDQSGDEVELSMGQNNRRSRKAPRSPKRGSSVTNKPKEEKTTVSAIGDQRGNKTQQAEKPSAKSSGNKEGFAPRGEPSRRGRGGGASRPRGGLGRGIDGYGPPAKSPFGPPRQDDKKCDSSSKQDEEDNRTKLGGMVPLSSAVNAKQGKPSAVPPRMQRSKESGDPGRGSSRRRGNGRGKSPSRTVMKQGSSDGAEENWETTSENSDDESRGGKSRRGGPNSGGRGGGGKGGTGPVSRPSQFSAASKAPGAEKKNGLANAIRQSPSPLTGRKENSPSLDISEADKKQRLEKEKSALDALDISTYSAVTSLAEEQLGNDDSTNAHYFSAFESSNGFSSRGGKKPPTPPITPPISGGRGSSSGGRGSKSAGAGPVGPQRDKQGSKPGYDRSRVSKLPPRLAKQKENNRLQKAAAASAMQQQQHHMGTTPDMLELARIYLKEPLNAWEKPLGPSSTLGGLTDSTGLEENVSGDVSGSKLTREVLGDQTAPVPTIIFENTNLRSSEAPNVSSTSTSSNSKYHQNVSSSSTLTRGLTSTSQEDSLPSFCEPNSTSVSTNEHLQLSFTKGEDSADMKLDFAFDSEILSDDKSKGRGPHQHPSAPSSGSSATGSTAELNLKIASVKKVWENTAIFTVLEHTGEDGSVPSQANTGFDQALESAGYKETPATEEVTSEVAYSSGEVMVSGSYPVAPGGTGAGSGLVKTDPVVAAATSSNVCKVKPQQQAVMSNSGPSPIGHPSPLSPPPTFSSTTAQQGHMGYPVGRSAGVEGVSCWQTAAALGGGATQFSSISAIPSPPTVLFNTNQQMQAQSGMYGAFQLDSQRSQFSQFPPYGLSTSNPAAGYSQQSLYLQTAPPPPPPAAPQPSEMYPAPPPSISQYRLQAAATPFGQTGPPQHVTSNPSTVLISSTSNSLMSASVKPSSQQHVGAIGSKAATYQTSAPPPPQQTPMYIYDHSSLLTLGGQNFVSNSQLVQRTGPVQSNVVPGAAIQPPTSFFSSNAPGQTGYYQGSSALQPPPHPAGPPSLHSAANPYASAAAAMSGYSAQGAGSAAAVGLQGYSTQMAAAAAAAQFRNPAAYLKSAGQPPPPPTDLGRQLKSPSSAELGVFPPGQQASSPKARTTKQPSLPSPTLQQAQLPKFGTYPSAAVMQHPLPLLPPQGLTDARWCVQQQQQQQQQQTPQQAQQQQQRGGNSGGVQRGGLGQQTPRYPNPIQRPAVPFAPQAASGMPQQNMSVRPPRLPQSSSTTTNNNQQQQQRSSGGTTKMYNAQGGTTQVVEKTSEETNGITSSSTPIPSSNSSTTDEVGVVVTPSKATNDNNSKIVEENKAQ